MESKILLVAATPYEIAPYLVKLQKEALSESKSIYKLNDKEISVLITGVGVFNMSFYCGLMFGSGYKPHLAINAGLGGSYDSDVALTTVVNVYKDTFADIGVTNKDASFSSVFDLELIKPNDPPFKGGWLENESGSASFLPNKTGITVNLTSGDENRINTLKSKYSPGVESMEGAAFAHACTLSGVKYLQIRALSNYVEPRNKLNWKIDQSIINLNNVLEELIDQI